MKKITSILTTLFLSFIAMNVNAQDVYLVGTPTDGNKLEEWVLTMDPNDTNSYYGEFEIPANEFSFYFDWGGFAFIPSSRENETVTFEEDEFTGKFALSETPKYWEYPEWEGGKVNIIVTIDPFNGNGDVTFIIEDGDTGGVNVIEGSQNKYFRVFNLNGTPVMEGENIDKLDKGIYIINGKKILVK